MNNNKTELLVAALENGTVIDHIPSELVFTIASLLQLDKLGSSVTIGYNLHSNKLGKKGIIKVADKFFSDEEISRLSVVAPNVVLNIIRNFDGVEEIRAATERSLDEGILLGLTMTVEEMKGYGTPIHHLTMDAREDMIQQGGVTI